MTDAEILADNRLWPNKFCLAISRGKEHAVSTGTAVFRCHMSALPDTWTAFEKTLIKKYDSIGELLADGWTVDRLAQPKKIDKFPVTYKGLDNQVYTVLGEHDGRLLIKNPRGTVHECIDDGHIRRVICLQSGG